MIKKLVKMLTPTRYNTVWTHPVSGWSQTLWGPQMRNVPMLIKLQISNKKTFRFILSDGDTFQTQDNEMVTTHLTEARNAALQFNCDI